MINQISSNFNNILVSCVSIVLERGGWGGEGWSKADSLRIVAETITNFFAQYVYTSIRLLLYVYL